MTRLAFIGLDRQLYLGDTDGGEPLQLSAPLPRAASGWGVLARTPELWSWPTWSPDGQWVAAFAVEGEADGSPIRVSTMSVDGVRQVEWALIPQMSPIYLQWHPSGEALTVLLQQETELVLSVIRKDRLGQVRPVEQGVPLFFNWLPSGERVLVHVGEKEEPAGRIVLRDPLGDAEDIQFERSPGSFCAPIFHRGRALVALRNEEGGSDVVLCRPDGTEAEILLERRGLLALMPMPGDGPWIAVAAAPRGEGTPYLGIELVHAETHEVRQLTTAECLAYFWSPTGDRIVYAQVDAEANCLHWHVVVVECGETVSLGSFWPTRDIFFYLHFFDQYATSHPIVSADGRWITFAGYPAGGGQADLSAPPRVYVKDLHHPERDPIVAGRGSFAVFPSRA